MGRPPRPMPGCFCLLIRFGPLKAWRLAAILLLAAGAVRLHEAMAFLGPIMAFACLQRCRAAQGRAARMILCLAAVLIAAGCAVGIHDVLHPRIAANRASFVQDLVSLRWLLIGDGQINMMAATGLLAVFMLPIAALPARARGPAMGAAAFLFMVLAILALVVPPCPPAAFAARNNACLMTAPAMLLLLVLRQRTRILPAGAVLTATALTAMLGFAIAAGDGAATAGWLGYTQAMRTALASGRGVLPWRTALADLPPREAHAMSRYAWPWTTPLMSLWLAPGSRVATVIANPPGVAWQPFAPEAMQPALATAETPATRSGFIALLDP